MRAKRSGAVQQRKTDVECAKYTKHVREAHYMRHKLKRTNKRAKPDSKKEKPPLKWKTIGSGGCVQRQQPTVQLGDARSGNDAINKNAAEYIITLLLHRFRALLCRMCAKCTLYEHALPGCRRVFRLLSMLVLQVRIYLRDTLTWNSFNDFCFAFTSGYTSRS